jgi:hypothetical protein
MRHATNSPRRWLLIGGALLLAITWGGVYLFLTAKTQAASIATADPPQPVFFNHEAMVQMGIQCLFCHADATRSPAAGMPSVEKCYGCHKTIFTDVPVIHQAIDYWNRQEPIPWARVNVLPRFVYFSHEVHVTAGGLNCERCHGDVGHMTVARQVVRMDMGWCLGCHEQQPNAAQLMDCMVCHQ